jgi:hypothetical protein
MTLRTLLALAILSQFGGTSAWALTHNLIPHTVYGGLEAVGEVRTGNKCFVTIQEVGGLEAKGLHCYSIDFDFNSAREDVPKNTLHVESRVTNYHRPEFPQKRTCAQNIDGTTSGDEIYGTDTTVLYNQIFGGMMKVGDTQFDYFLTLSPLTKEPVRARIHIQNSSVERDLDCVNLERM